MFDNVLTDFTVGPAPENPLYEGGNWTQTVGSRPPMQKTAPGVVTDSAHFPPNYSHWVRDRFSSGGPVEAWICTEGGQLGAAVETWRVALWSEVADHLSGYLVMFGGGLGKALFLRRYDDGVDNATDLMIGGLPGGAYPSRLGIRIVGDNVQAWVDIGSGMVLFFDVPDTTYRGLFWAGIAVEDPSGGGLSISCFGATRVNRTQFIRWVPITAD